MFANKNNQIFAGLALAALLGVIFSLGYQYAPNGSALETFFFALGGQMPQGLIQIATFACFFICLFGIQHLTQRLRAGQKIYGARLLPETEQFVLYPEDVNRIKLETIEAERRLGAHPLTDLIKQAATKFRSNSSPAETLAMVETVSDMQRKATEKDFWLINICQTLIPTFGFLGTVWGMAAAILSMGQSQTAASTASITKDGVPAPPNVISSNDIQGLIDNMGTAFFTTIVAIVLGIVVNVLLKRLESEVEDYHTGIKRYVVENLVNRISL